MNRILTIIAVLLGIGWMVAGRGNKAADKPANEYENKDVDRESTLDSCWQQKADSLLRKAIRSDKRIKGACIAVMNVWSGNVPVMVNLSRNANADEYYNFAACLGYEPGPVMEPLTWTVALDDGIFHSEARLKESISTGSILEAYKNIPGHYVEALRSFLPEGGWNTIEVEGVKQVEMPDPKSPEWSEQTVQALSKGYSMKVSPLHVMTFYGALASGNIVGAHLILGAGRDVPLSRYNEIDRSLIINALGCDDKDGLVGMASVSRFNEYGNSSRAGETFAGFFPKDEPEYAVICAIFTDRPYSGYRMTGVAKKVAEELSGLISAGMVRETFPDWRKFEETCYSEDGAVMVRTWYREGRNNNPKYHNDLYVRMPSGKMSRILPDFISGYRSTDIQKIEKEDGGSYYVTSGEQVASSENQHNSVPLKAFRLNGQHLEYVDIDTGEPPVRDDTSSGNWLRRFLIRLMNHF